MTAESSNTFCILPWIHMYVNADGSVLPCCIADHHKSLGNTYTQKIVDIWNNDQYKILRRNMLSGQKCNECNACYKNEESGIKSFRQSVNEQFKKHISLTEKTNDDGSLDFMQLKYFDVRWSNICNFKCRSCSSTYSSSWATEDNNNGYNKRVYIFAGGENNDDLYQQFLPHFENIEEFYFAGGEPLLTDKHYDILEYLISIGKTNVKLRYNTNLSNLKFKNKHVIDLWKKFKKVEVFASLDSWGERAEYIREGTVWSTIEDNIRLIRKETPHVNLQLSSVISIFNILTISDFLNYLIDKQLFDKNKLQPSFYNIINPNYYSVEIFEDSIKEKILDKLYQTKINSHVDRQIENVIFHVKNSKFDPFLKEQFLDETDKYDDIRNRNFVNTFPELKDWFING